MVKAVNNRAIQAAQTYKPFPMCVYIFHHDGTTLMTMVDECVVCDRHNAYIRWWNKNTLPLWAHPPNSLHTYTTPNSITKCVRFVEPYAERVSCYIHKLSLVLSDVSHNLGVTMMSLSLRHRARFRFHALLMMLMGNYTYISKTNRM